MAPRMKRRKGQESQGVAEAPHLGLRIDFKVPLAVGEFNDLDDLECVDSRAKRKEIKNFNVKRL